MPVALKAGDKAPDFKTKDENGTEVSLSDFKGTKVALFFYPQDDTETCTKQACNLRDNLPGLTAAGYQVLGVSVDDEKSHRKFIKKFGLNFRLLADVDHQLVDKYGVWQERTLFGHTYMGIVRTTFLIDGMGKIERVIDKVKSAEHAAQILEP